MPETVKNSVEKNPLLQWEQMERWRTISKWRTSPANYNKNMRYLRQPSRSAHSPAWRLFKWRIVETIGLFNVTEFINAECGLLERTITLKKIQVKCNCQIRYAEDIVKSRLHFRYRLAWSRESAFALRTSVQYRKSVESKNIDYSVRLPTARAWLYEWYYTVCSGCRVMVATSLIYKKIIVVVKFHAMSICPTSPCANTTRSQVDKVYETLLGQGQVQEWTTD